MIYLNGAYMPLADARIPILDRGFIFGDGVYEVIPVYSRQAFRLNEHLRRLQHSLDGIRLANPHTPAEWQGIIEQVVAGNPWNDQSVYLQITRGVAPRDHAFPKNTPPTVFVMSNPLTAPPAELRQTGVSAVTALDNRWLRCDIKSTALLANVLLRQLAVDAGAAETLLLREGYLTEGAASNIFAVKNGVLLAPPKDHRVLPGITYDVVLELAQQHGIPHEVREISEAEVRSADELWLTSSTKEVLPITQLDGVPVANGQPGPIYAAMYGYYQDFKRTVMRGEQT